MNSVTFLKKAMQYDKIIFFEILNYFKYRRKCKNTSREFYLIKIFSPVKLQTWLANYQLQVNNSNPSKHMVLNHSAQGVLYVFHQTTELEFRF